MSFLTSEQYLESNDFPFFCENTLIQPHTHVDAHAHEFVELVYVEKGSGLHHYNGVEHKITEGDVFVIVPNIEHAYTTDDEGIFVYNVLFQPQLLKREIEALSEVSPFVGFYYVEPFLRGTSDFQSLLRLRGQERLEMKNLLDHIILEGKEQRPGYRILTKTRLIELFVFLSRCYDRTHQDTTLRTMASDEKIMMQITRFIQMHYAEALTLEQVSQICGMSQSSFSAKFKSYTGKSFIEYRNGVRLQAAREKLLESDEKIVHIAQSVGYDDLSYFNQQFKLQTGCSPGQYRKTNKK